MKGITVIAFFFAFGTTALAAEAKGAALGVLDLTQHDFNAGQVRLDGEWEFYWKEFRGPAVRDFEGELSSRAYLRQPGNWLAFHPPGGQPASGESFATYRLKLLLPPNLAGQSVTFFLPIIGTSYAMFVDGKEIARVGRVGKDKDTSAPAYRELLRTLEVKGPQMDVVFHVSNFSHRSAGLWYPIEFGLPDQVGGSRQNRLFLDFFLFGGVLITGLYHIGLFLNRRDDKASLLFGLFCIVFAVRIVFTGSTPIVEFWPEVPWNLILRVSYATHLVAPPLLGAFLALLFGGRWTRHAVWTMNLVVVPFLLHVLFFPPLSFTRWSSLHQLLIVGIVFYATVTLAIGLWKKTEGAAAAFFGAFVFAATVINDMFLYRTLGTSEFTSPVGLFVFIFSQSYLLSRLFASAFKSVRRLTETLRLTNAAYSRFVPIRFLELLGKKDITQIELGDHVSGEMTILFADIRAFTSMSERMTPYENFSFLNEYLDRISPVILRHGGIIDKYIGDSIMAVFPDSPEAAVQAAVEIQEEVRSYNKSRQVKNTDEVHVAVGIHTGPLLLGTVGVRERMDGTAISDAVNVAARIEELTKRYGVDIMISESTLWAMPQSVKFHLRYADRAEVRGRVEKIALFQVLDSLEPDIREKTVAARDEFENSVAALYRGETAEASRGFEKILAENPDDALARHYYDRCRKAA